MSRLTRMAILEAVLDAGSDSRRPDPGRSLEQTVSLAGRQSA
jgi:hypothetical protein